MLPIVWFFLVVVSFLWILLLYTELRKRARRHVRGCPSLPYISPERLDSLIIIEPDLKILELGLPQGNPGIPDARQMRVDQIEGLVSHLSRSTILVFYASVKEPVNWNSLSVNTCCVTHSYLREVSKRGRAASMLATLVRSILQAHPPKLA
jgi:hypothetical protein